MDIFLGERCQCVYEVRVSVCVTWGLPGPLFLAAVTAASECVRTGALKEETTPNFTANSTTTDPKALNTHKHTQIHRQICCNETSATETLSVLALFLTFLWWAGAGSGRRCSSGSWLTAAALCLNVNERQTEKKRVRPPPNLPADTWHQLCSNMKRSTSTGVTPEWRVTLLNRWNPLWLSWMIHLW